VTDRQTDIVNIGKNRLHLVHSMQPKKRRRAAVDDVLAKFYRAVILQYVNIDGVRSDKFRPTSRIHELRDVCAPCGQRFGLIIAPRSPACYNL